MTRVMVVDDHPLVRRGLKETLAGSEFVVVAEAGHADDVLPALHATPCDVVILDVSLPGRSGIEVLKELSTEFPRLRVLVVSTYGEAEYAVRAIRAGAAGYLTKQTAPEELTAALRAIVRTGRYISDGVAAELANYAVRDGAAPTDLSDREHEVFRLLVAGKSVGDIAAELSLSAKTVSTYGTRVKDKLGLKTTGDLIRYAIEHRLFEQ